MTTIFPEISEVTTEQQLEHSSVKLLTILTIEKENFTHVIIFVSTTIFLVLLSLLTGIALAKRYKCQCRFVNKKGRGYVSGNQQKLRELRSDESIKTRNDAYISAIPDSDSNLSVLKIREDGFSDEHRGHLYDDVDSELSGSTTLYLDPFEKDNPKSINIATLQLLVFPTNYFLIGEKSPWNLHQYLAFLTKTISEMVRKTGVT